VFDDVVAVVVVDDNVDAALVEDWISARWRVVIEAIAGHGKEEGSNWLVRVVAVVNWRLLLLLSFAAGVGGGGGVWPGTVVLVLLGGVWIGVLVVLHEDGEMGVGGVGNEEEAVVRGRLAATMTRRGGFVFDFVVTQKDLMETCLPRLAFACMGSCH
jgi:hypothetical protein